MWTVESVMPQKYVTEEISMVRFLFRIRCEVGVCGANTQSTFVELIREDMEWASLSDDCAPDMGGQRLVPSLVHW